MKFKESEKIIEEIEQEIGGTLSFNIIQKMYTKDKFFMTRKERRQFLEFLLPRHMSLEELSFIHGELRNKRLFSDPFREKVFLSIKEGGNFKLSSSFEYLLFAYMEMKSLNRKEKIEMINLIKETDDHTPCLRDILDDMIHIIDAGKMGKSEKELLNILNRKLEDISVYDGEKKYMYQFLAWYNNEDVPKKRRKYLAETYVVILEKFKKECLLLNLKECLKIIKSETAPEDVKDIALEALKETPDENIL